jgi:tellurite resistance protein
MCSDFARPADGMSLTAQMPNATTPPGTYARAEGVRWVAPGQRVIVGDATIEGGLFYLDESVDVPLNPLDSCVVGTAHEIDPITAEDVSTSRSYAENRSTEFSYGDDADGIDSADSGARSVRPSLLATTVQGPTAAWISYAALTPAQRRAFIEWLASDRTAQGVHVGYLNLYLYGLERRVLLDGSHGELADDDYESIALELRRMLKLSSDWSFQTHVENLIESVTVLRVAPTRLYQETPRVRATRGYQVPFTVRVAFGQAAVDNAPVPAEWAFAWASLDSAITRKPPLARIPEPFRLLFLKLYRARLRDGMRVAPNRTRLKFPDTAFPALRELDVPESVGVIPDLSAVTAPRGRLQQLVNECVEALAPYGRYIVRTPGAEGTLDAALMLTPDLWPEALRRQLDATVTLTREHIEVMRFSDLLASFKAPAGLGREKIVSFVSVLGQAGVGVEPDIRTGARTPRPDDCVALFAIDPAMRIVDEDCAYLTAALMIDVAATLAMADGEATHPELTLMHHHIEHAMRLSEAQQERLKARVAVQLTAPQSLASLKKRLDPLSTEERHVLASFLVQTANADGVVTPEEVRLLEKIYRMLELDTQQLYSDLHHDASTPARGTRKTSTGAGARDPAHAGDSLVPRDPASSGSSGSRARARASLDLDPARISALQDETAQVSALLAQVFAQDAEDERDGDEAAATPIDNPSTTSAPLAANAVDAVGAIDAADSVDAVDAVDKRDNGAPVHNEGLHSSAAASNDTAPGSDDEPTLLGLDDAHSTFLRLLVSRPRWTRQELLDAAADLELMLDGAMEQVNEASLDHWDEPLTDGDDPVEINQELAQRLAA